MYKRDSNFVRFDRVVLVGLHLENPSPNVTDPVVKARLVYADEEGRTYGFCDWGPQAEMSNETQELIKRLVDSIEKDFGEHVFKHVTPDGPLSNQGIVDRELKEATGIGGSR